MDFRAPDVRVLVVDDNKMSLTLAKNMISSFGIRVDSAESGEDAISMLENMHYHMVFMDYLMPGMDGVETTKLIRQKDTVFYREIPIIALTGEDMPDEELFRNAGMNDYLPKPLGKVLLQNMLIKWLPVELLQETGETKSRNDKEGIVFSDLPGIRVVEGIRNSGGQDKFCSFLGDFYKLIDVKAELLESYLADGMIKEYTIEVHALKNSARIIGAMELSEYFRLAEQMGKLGDTSGLEIETPKLLAMYRGFKPILEPYGIQQTAGTKIASVEDIVICLRGLQEAVDAFDLDSADQAMEQLEEFCLPEKCGKLMEKLRAAVADVAMENILVLAEEIIIDLKEY